MVPTVEIGNDETTTVTSDSGKTPLHAAHTFMVGLRDSTPATIVHSTTSIHAVETTQNKADLAEPERAAKSSADNLRATSTCSLYTGLCPMAASSAW